MAQAAHNGLAVYLSRHGGDVQQEWAHRLAAAIISYQAGSGSLTQYVSRLAWSFAMSAESAVPTSFCEVCRIVDQVEGVHLVDLVTALSPRAPDGQAAMTEVLRLAREHEFRTRQRHLDEWEPVIAGLVAANRGDQAAAEAVDHALAARGEQPDWTHLVAVQRRIRAGDRDPALAIGLDWIDTAIVRRTLDALTGEAPIDPKAWRALTTPTDQEQNQWLTDLVRTTVAAATGDPDAATGLQTVLEDLTASPDWTTLAAVLRRILAGDRDPGLLDGLDATDTAVVTDVLTQLNEDRTIDLTATQTPQASQ